MKIHKIKYAFTLIEIMLWILIVSIVLIWAFQSLSSLTIWKTKLIQETEIRKESFYFLEKMTQMIKRGGTIDYEEYFNRKVIWNNSFSNWHYSTVSWYWNFWKDWIINDTDYWEWFYYCRSWNGVKMQWNWCFNDGRFNSWSIDYSWDQQRYWQYSFQFIDYNSNFDADLWDEDNDTKIIWDDDDEYLGKGPDVFTDWSDLKELYLISANWKQRTIIRWNIKTDSNARSWETCTLTTWENIPDWQNWCIWTIEYLKLDWKDWWLDHEESTNDNTEWDWVIDTWIINRDFHDKTDDIVAWTEDISIYFVEMFPESINVADFQVYAYPNKDIDYAWKETDDKINISPYVILKIKIKPSWLSIKKLNVDPDNIKEIDLSMTVNLTELYSQ